MPENESRIERADLKRLEAIVDAGLPAFREVGVALSRIKNRGLWRQTGATTFADYALIRFGLGTSYAYQVIEASQAVLALSTNAEKITNVHQASMVARIMKTDGERTANKIVSAVARSKQPMSAGSLLSTWARLRDEPLVTAHHKREARRVDWRAVAIARPADEIADQLAELVARERIDRSWALKLANDILTKLAFA